MALLRSPCGEPERAVLADEIERTLHARDQLDRDFANCKRFESRVDCYTLCPAMDENGEFREVSASWRKDC